MRWAQFELGIRESSAHYLTGEFAATVARIDPLQRSQADAYDAGQRTLLGDDGFQALKEYERTESRREAVDRLAGFAATTGTPLTIDQTTRLTAALDANWEALKTTLETESVSRIWATLQASDADLSPTELQFLQDLQSIEQHKAARKRSYHSGNAQR